MQAGRVSKEYCIVCLTEIDPEEGCPDHKDASFIEKAVLDWAAYNGIKIDTKERRQVAISRYFRFY